MEITPAALNFFVDPLTWTADWAWGVPLIVLNVIIHVLGLGLMSESAIRISGNMRQQHHPMMVFVAVMGVMTLLVTTLHGIEAGIWAAAYRLLGALPDEKSSIIYSLNALTSFGHTNLSLEDKWQLMGAMEALNGWLLFGLTTAFLFAVIEKVSFTNTRRDHR
jgi:MFS superfamily sulfate permease-like transporter